jgi:4-amino-4-deoxy-L-arabinose transferase-like glycosyltransferase
MRFDILAPVWVLAACLGFVRAEATGSRLGFFATGALVGLATLSHVWGAFVLPVLVGLLLWRRGWLARRAGGGVLVVAGFLVMLSPWVAFILGDAASFLGQMCRHHGRFDVLDPRWYLTNLLHEHWRYAPWVGGAFRQPLLWPRVGLWVVAGATVWANVTLLSRLRRDSALADGLIFAALPALALAMALLVNQKRYPYTLLVLPFLALQVGLGVASAWRWAERAKPLRWLTGAVFLLAVGEGAAGVAHGLVLAHAATPYAEVTAAAARAIPEGARVLIPQPYWMGLRGFTTRSLVLVHLLADSRCHPGGGAPSMEEAWQQVGADYLIEEDRFVSYRNPANPAVEALWRDFVRVARSRCPAAVGRVAVPGYEAAMIYRCER